jgi:hypothetical protein
MRVNLLIGTNKGLFIYYSDAERRNWTLEGPYLSGWEVYSVLGDRKDGNRLYAGTSHAAYGATVRISEDKGLTWQQVEAGPSYSKESGFSLNRIWQLAQGLPSEPTTLYAGVEDAGIFVSRDRGLSWSELDGLTKHPTRPGWFPGAGGMCLHTILIDPNNSQRIWIGISAVGVFRSLDGGLTWKTCNEGLSRVPTGMPYPEVGYCVHKMVLDPVNPDIIYMQEHSGVFQSNNGGDSWFPIEEGLTLKEGDEPFGFPIAISPTGDLFLMPLESSEQRSMRDGKLLVYARLKGTSRWEPIGDVVPDEQKHVSVLRDAMTVDSLDPNGLYFGTTSGEVYVSLDRGVNWDRLPGQFSRILSVKTWIVEE